MKQNQILLLTAVLAVTAGAAIWKQNQRSGAIGEVPNEVGKDLLKGFQPSEVASFTVTDAKGAVTIEQKDGKWIVPARDGFPASVDAVNALIDNAAFLKVAEIQRVGESRFPQLKLKKPGEGGTEEETGTQVSFLDSAGKEIKAFTAGKTLSADETEPGAFNMNPSGPKSQYIKVAGEDGYVYKARDGFTRLETEIKGWLDKSAFIKIERIKSVTSTGVTPEESWKISRETESAEMKLDAPDAGEEFEAAKASALGSVFSYVQFTDVLPAADAAKAVLDNPVRTVVIETFDGFTYTVKVGAAEDEGQYLTYSVEGQFAETRTPPEPAEKDKPAETEEQKKTADEAFAKSLEDKKKKLAAEQAHQSVIFVLPKSSVEPVLKKRPDFMKDKPAESPDGAAAPDFTQPALPGSPGGPRIEAVTPPISVEIPSKEPSKTESNPKPEAEPASGPGESGSGDGQ